MAVRPLQLVYLAIPAGWLLVSALNLFSFFHQRSNIWWTPLPMSTPLALSGDRVEVYARGTDLRMLVDGGQVRIGGTPPTAAAFRAPRHNPAQKRASRIPPTQLSSFTPRPPRCRVLFSRTR